MFALLPLVGGLLLGLLAPRRTAIAAQILLCGLAVALLTSSAPDHGGSYRDIVWIAPVLALASAGALLLGFWCARVTARRSAEPRR
jgi:hypothetical protein